MPIRLEPIKDSEMNPDGNIFLSNENFDSTLAELQAEISRVLPGVPAEEIQVSASWLDSDRIIVMRLH